MAQYQASAAQVQAYLDSMSQQDLEFYSEHPRGASQFVHSRSQTQQPVSWSGYSSSGFTQPIAMSSNNIGYQYTNPTTSTWMTSSTLSSYRGDVSYQSMQHGYPADYSLTTIHYSSGPQRKSSEPNICPYSECAGQAFMRKGDLQRHIDTIHDPLQTRYPCPIKGCNRNGEGGLPRPDKVLDHIREKHKLPVPKTKKGGRPFDLIAWLKENGIALDPNYRSTVYQDSA